VVDAVGREVRTLAPGDRIAAVSYDAYAEYDLVEEPAAVKIPEALGEQPFPGEALGCAMNIFRRARMSSLTRRSIERPSSACASSRAANFATA
jgi:hypothetical protein